MRHLRAVVGHAPTILILLSTLPDLAAQTVYSWHEHTGVVRPFARSRHRMVYDAARRETVLFGGHNGSFLADTWVYDGVRWRERTSATPPPARADHALAYDPLRERVVLLGGTGAAGTLTDVWEWDGVQWTLVAATVPGVSYEGAACYDPIQGGVFYNARTTNLLWDGATARSIAAANPQGDATALVFDAANRGPVTSNNGRTAVFRPRAGWTFVSNMSGFSLYNYALAIDPFTQRIVLQGGQGSVGSGSGSGSWHTFVYRGGAWGLVQPQFPTDGRDRHAMVFDLDRRRFVMFGGRRNQGGITDETWELSSQEWPASWQPLGASCSGSTAFTPSLAPESSLNSAPILGGSWFVRLDGLPPQSLAFGVVGFSDQVFGGQPLPVDLTSLGMPGCSLFVSIDLVEVPGLANAAGWLWWRIDLPPQSALLGETFLQQAAVVHPPANAGGLLWTGYGRGTIGAP